MDSAICKPAGFKNFNLMQIVKKKSVSLAFLTINDFFSKIIPNLVIMFCLFMLKKCLFHWEQICVKTIGNENI